MRLWAWLLRHAGWQIRYKQKGNGMRAYKQAYGEHCTHEVVPFAEVMLVRIPKPTHRALQEGKRWHKGDAVFVKGVFGLEGVRLLANTLSSRLEVVCSHKQFDDWNRLVDVMLDFTGRWNVSLGIHNSTTATCFGRREH